MLEKFITIIVLLGQKFKGCCSHAFHIVNFSQNLWYPSSTKKMKHTTHFIFGRFFEKLQNIHAWPHNNKSRLTLRWGNELTGTHEIRSSELQNNSCYSVCVHMFTRTIKFKYVVWLSPNLGYIMSVYYTEKFELHKFSFNLLNCQSLARNIIFWT